MNGTCDFFQWYGASMSNHAQIMILGLLQRIERRNGLEDGRQQKKMVKWFKIIVILLVGFVFGRICS